MEIQKLFKKLNPSENLKNKVLRRIIKKGRSSESIKEDSKKNENN